MQGLVFFNVLPQLLDFYFECLVFRDFARQELRRNLGFFLDSATGQQIHIGFFITTILEIVRLDQTLFDECLQTIIGLAHADAELACEVALTNFWVGLELF